MIISIDKDRLSQNYKSIHGKYSELIRYRREIPWGDKTHLWKSYR